MPTTKHSRKISRISLGLRILTKRRNEKYSVSMN